MIRRTRPQRGQRVLWPEPFSLSLIGATPLLGPRNPAAEPRRASARRIFSPAPAHRLTLESSRSGRTCCASPLAGGTNAGIIRSSPAKSQPAERVWQPTDILVSEDLQRPPTKAGVGLWSSPYHVSVVLLLTAGAAH